MKKLFRACFIAWTALRYGLDEMALSCLPRPWLRALGRLTRRGRRLTAPRGQRLRMALERLGPIFVKFGQVLSTRRDLLPPDVADELALLQDRVPPFATSEAIAIIEKAFGRPLGAIFTSFEREPVASASIAQVHFATLTDREGKARDVAVKVLRPGMLKVIDQDLALIHMLAGWVERLFADGKRLRPREVAEEFDKYLHDELDLTREAASAAQLRRNMAGLDLVLVPEMFWDHIRDNVLVMERMSGIPISQTQRLREAGVDIHQLARDGVTIFFTQVFRDGFFHADMHPGNIMVSVAPGTFGRYICRGLYINLTGTPTTALGSDYRLSVSGRSRCWLRSIHHGRCVRFIIAFNFRLTRTTTAPLCFFFCIGSTCWLRLLCYFFLCGALCLTGAATTTFRSSYRLFGSLWGRKGINIRHILCLSISIQNT